MSVFCESVTLAVQAQAVLLDAGTNTKPKPDWGLLYNI